MVKQLKCLTHRLDGNFREGYDVSKFICFYYTYNRYVPDVLASKVFTEKMVSTPQISQNRMSVKAVHQDDIEVKQHIHK